MVEWTRHSRSYTMVKPQANHLIVPKISSLIECFLFIILTILAWAYGSACPISSDCSTDQIFVKFALLAYAHSLDRWADICAFFSAIASGLRYSGRPRVRSSSRLTCCRLLLFVLAMGCADDVESSESDGRWFSSGAFLSVLLPDRVLLLRLPFLLLRLLRLLEPPLSPTFSLKHSPVMGDNEASRRLVLYEIFSSLFCGSVERGS